MRREQPDAPTNQIFWSRSGLRWIVVLALSVMLLSAIGMSVRWIHNAIPQPVNMTATRHTDVSWPRKALVNQPKPLPEIGDGVLTRVDEVRVADGVTVLADPFSDRTYRPATEDETDVIGTATFVTERFGVPGDHQLMLSFDDGPSSVWTPQVLELLARNHVPATFFNIGAQVPGSSELVQQVIDQGNMLGNHTEDHRTDFGAHNPLSNRAELTEADRAIRAAADYTTRLWRLPEGDPDLKSEELLTAQQLGYLQVDFSLDTNDWKFTAGQNIPVPDLDGKGYVVLMHDGGGDRSDTLRLLQSFIDQAKAKGYSFSTLEPLLPPDFVPQKDTPASLLDMLPSWSTTIPAAIMGFLSHYGVISLLLLSAAYLMLAWANHYRHQMLFGTGAHSRIGASARRRLMKDREPWITVLLPVYNEATVLFRTLDSLKASTYRHFTVIAVNDGSTDMTKDILEAYSANWDQLRLIHQPNRGKSSALNAGLELVTTEFYVTMDGDTVFEPDTIAKLIRNFRDPRVGGVGGHVKVGNRNNVLTWWQSMEYLVGICVTRMAEGTFNGILTASGCVAAWRTDAARQVGGYSEDTRAEDSDFTIAIRRYTKYRIVQDNEAICYTQAPDNLNDLLKQRLRWVFGSLQAMYKHRAMLGNPRYGLVGVSVAYSLLSIVAAMVFTPVIIGMAIYSAIDGSWHTLITFGVMVAVIHLVQMITALVMLKEHRFHLLMVPLYRFIYEPLRIYLLYMSLFYIVVGRGKAYRWNKLERKADFGTDAEVLATPAGVAEIP